MDLENKVKRVAWGITGSGDEIRAIIDSMIEADKKFDDVEIRVYVSKAGEQVLRMYQLWDDLHASFNKTQVEKSSNLPFLPGELQSGRYDFFLIAPTTSNTTAKISLGLGDSLISNAVSMANKSGVPVYVLPCELGEGTTQTALPNGTILNLRIRERDTKHIQALSDMDGIFIIKSPREILEVFQKYYERRD
jgi:archaeoflavoprotein AfpA